MESRKEIIESDQEEGMENEERCLPGTEGENSLDDQAESIESMGNADEEGEDWLDEEDAEENGLQPESRSGKDDGNDAAAGTEPEKRVFLTSRNMLVVIVLLVLVLILGGIYSYLMSPKQWEYSIRLKGPSKLELYQGDKYVEKGAEATCTNSLTGIERKLSVSESGKVDSHRPGTYEVTYKASYLGKTVQKKRTVIVRENFDYARSMSMYDTVSSSATSPVIGLYGGRNLTVYDAFGFKDGFVATDDTAGYVTDRVEVSGQVDDQTPGSYRLSYSVTDEDGQLTVAERLVTVKHYEPPVKRELAEGEKIIYLTFDDGPAKFTDEILSILDRYGVKATFFVTATSGEQYQSLIRKEVEKGHAVGVHSCTHSYAQVYSNDQAYWDDFNKMNALIEAQTGHKVDIMRFPGGSSNTVSKKYCEGIMTRLANEATSQGYTFFDWNVSSGDASGLKDSEKILENMKNGVMKNDRSIVLCHDTHEFTKNAVEPFLQWALSNGYSFDILRNGDDGAHQSIAN